MTLMKQSDGKYLDSYMKKILVQIKDEEKTDNEYNVTNVDKHVVVV